MLIDMHAHLWQGQIEENKKTILEAMERYEISKVYLSGLGEHIPTPEPVSYTHLDVYKRQTLEYVLARRTGNDLDSLYTTVIEPYKNERYLESIEPATLAIVDGTPKDDSARAVKVTHKSGRVDYIVYASDRCV